MVTERKIFSDRMGAIAVFFLRAAGNLTAPLGGKGFWHFANVVGKLIPSSHEQAEALLLPDIRMAFSLKDPYWNRIASAHFHYESDLEFVFEKIAILPFCFIDGGANLGYWSLLLSSEKFGAHPCVAVEASPTTFSLLSNNVSRNKKDISCVHGALFSQQGEVSFVDHTDHASSGVGESENSFKVPSLTLADLCARFHSLEDYVIKLDVEGAEISALQGLKGVSPDNYILLYEDHGRDTSHSVTKFIKEKMGYRVFFLFDNGLQEVSALSDLDQWKSKASRGYNLLAFAPGSKFGEKVWERLLPLANTPRGNA